LANNIVPQFFGIQSNAENLSTSSITADAPQQLFANFGQLLNAVPKEQLNQIIGGMMTNPMVNQLMSQLLVSIAAMSPQLMTAHLQSQPKVPVSKKEEEVKTNFTLHDAVCNVCSNRIVGIRYKCTVCSDFDLCESCEQKDIGHNEDHSFIKIRRHVPQNDNSIWDSKFVCDISFPDGTTLPVCNKFTKIWRLENCGTAKWPIGTKLVYVGGDQFATTPELIVPSIEPRQHVDIALDCQSPKQPGKYVCYWRLASPSGQQFGVKIWVTVITEKSKEEEMKLAKLREEENIRTKKLEEEKKRTRKIITIKSRTRKTKKRTRKISN